MQPWNLSQRTACGHFPQMVAWKRLALLLRSNGPAVFTGAPEDFFVAQTCEPCLSRRRSRFEEIFDGRFEQDPGLYRARLETHAVEFS
jgi:hypothetical protein